MCASHCSNCAEGLGGPAEPGGAMDMGLIHRAKCSTLKALHESGQAKIGQLRTQPDMSDSTPDQPTARQYRGTRGLTRGNGDVTEGRHLHRKFTVRWGKSI